MKDGWAQDMLDKRKRMQKCIKCDVQPFVINMRDLIVLRVLTMKCQENDSEVYKRKFIFFAKEFRFYR